MDAPFRVELSLQAYHAIVSDCYVINQGERTYSYNKGAESISECELLNQVAWIYERNLRLNAARMNLLTVHENLSRTIEKVSPIPFIVRSLPIGQEFFDELRMMQSLAERLNALVFGDCNFITRVFKSNPALDRIAGQLKLDEEIWRNYTSHLCHFESFWSMRSRHQYSVDEIMIQKSYPFNKKECYDMSTMGKMLHSKTVVNGSHHVFIDYNRKYTSQELVDLFTQFLNKLKNRLALSNPPEGYRTSSNPSNDRITYPTFIDVLNQKGSESVLSHAEFNYLSAALTDAEKNLVKLTEFNVPEEALASLKADIAAFKLLNKSDITNESRNHSSRANQGKTEKMLRTINGDFDFNESLPGVNFEPSVDKQKKIDGYYQVLGLAPNKSYTLQEIKAAWKAMTLKNHPDKNHSDDAHERIQAINEAYAQLKDIHARTPDGAL